MDYLFEYAKTKVREHGYGSLTEAEKWDWHGDVYGFRRVFQGTPASEHTSPIDPSGRWYDENRAKLAEAHYREKCFAGTERHRRAVGEALYAAE
jgi:hypothetical protein